MRSYGPIFALILPIALGFVLIFLFTEGAIGIATVLAGSFALVAVAVTAVVFPGDTDESDAGSVRNSRLRL